MTGINISGRAVAPPPPYLPYQRYDGVAGTDIVYVPLAGGAPVTVVADGEDNESPVTSPDYSQIAYIKWEADRHLFIVDRDGSNETLLDTGHHRILEWSPDGSVIAFTAFESGEYNSILTIEPDGSNRTVLYSTANANDFINRPVYSHDGTKIAFSRNVETVGIGHEYGEVWTIDADGTNANKIDDVYDGYLLENSVSWSPDDSKLGYGDGGNPLTTYPPPGFGRTGGRWVVIDADGSNRVEVGSQTPGTGDEAESSKLSWAPDGSGIFVPEWTADSRWSLKFCAADGSNYPGVLVSPTFRIFDRPNFTAGGRIYCVAYEEPVFTSITFDSILPDGSDRRVEDPAGADILLEWFE